MIGGYYYAQSQLGYIAGTGDGIVSVSGLPANRKIYVFDAKTLTLLKTTTSLQNGRYLISNLDPTRQYLVMARDYKKEFEPAVWDYVTPATDLSIKQQQQLWQQMQGDVNGSA